MTRAGCGIEIRPADTGLRRLDPSRPAFEVEALEAVLLELLGDAPARQAAVAGAAGDVA